jgi:uncharacterized repeat protein (TIGR02543 family)
MRYLLFILSPFLFISCGTESTPVYTISTSVNGEGEIEPSSGEFEEGETVTLTATPTQHWVFDEWGGDASGTSSSVTITMDADKNILGNFIRKEYPLSITIDGEGTVDEQVITKPKTTDYPFETVVELTPIPDPEWKFTGWSGDVSSEDLIIQVPVNGETTITSTFEQREYPLSITNNGGGVISERIISQSKASNSVNQVTVELQPLPKTGWVFVGWGGDVDSSDEVITITVDREKKITALFKKAGTADYPLNINIEGEGTVEEELIQPKSTNYPEGTVVKLTAIPSENWEFLEWSGDFTSNDEVIELSVLEETTLTVTFEKPFFLHQNSITIMCPNTEPGDRGIVNDVEYESVDRNLLEQRRDEGVDLTQVCTSLVTDMRDMFYETNFNQPIGNWDVSNVTNMVRMFDNSPFNQPIGEWDVSNVTNMGGMFEGTPFDQDISSWDVSNVTDMGGMFRGTPFNQPIGSWDVSSVERMGTMFLNSNFNQPIGNWNVSSVESMGAMFKNSNFNQPIGNWNVSSVRYMGQMFENSDFNQPIGNWDVSSVTSMIWMFRNSSFNQPIGSWDVSSVSSFMSGMFEGTPFDQDISSWDVSNVTDMSGMFSDSDFNQPIGEWDVSSVKQMWNMFQGSDFNQPIENWDVGNVTDMSGMFGGTPFNQPIGSWDVSNVTDMSGMFAGTPFNQPIGNWDVSNVADMGGMFWNSDFNQPIGDWDVSNVTDMGGMFQDSDFNQPIGDWDVSNVTDMGDMFWNSDFNQRIGNWDVSSVTNMNSMFYSAENFNQDLSDWCVIKITRIPDSFDYNTPQWILPKPVWGTCPD